LMFLNLNFLFLLSWWFKLLLECENQIYLSFVFSNQVNQVMDFIIRIVNIINIKTHLIIWNK
jgi:hypothetical protein